MPALEEDGRVAGVIAASIDLHWIERIGADVARRPGALMMVGEDNGTVLAAHPGRDAWLRKRFESNPLLRELQTRDIGIETVAGIDGMRRVFGFARLPQTSAFVAVGLDEAEMLRRVDAEMRMTYIQFALIGVFVLLGVWVGGEHAIVRPLRALARMAVHIGHGNLQIRTTRRRWAAEFVPLAGALDAMAHRLTEREEELRVANANLEALARHDSLSGLANRRSFDAKLEEEWRESARQSTPLALVMIDVDHFKLYNDHYGHLAGDACLRAVGEALAQTSEAAIVARYGGEEFALLFGRTAMERALDLAEKLRSRIEALASAARHRAVRPRHRQRRRRRAARRERQLRAGADRGRGRGALRRQAPRPQCGGRARRDPSGGVAHVPQKAWPDLIGAGNRFCDQGHAHRKKALIALIKEDHATRASARVPTRAPGC